MNNQNRFLVHEVTREGVSCDRPRGRHAPPRSEVEVAIRWVSYAIPRKHRSLNDLSTGGKRHTTGEQEKTS